MRWNEGGISTNINGQLANQDRPTRAAMQHRDLLGKYSIHDCDDSIPAGEGAERVEMDVDEAKDKPSGLQRPQLAVAVAPPSDSQMTPVGRRGPHPLAYRDRN